MIECELCWIAGTDNEATSFITSLKGKILAVCESCLGDRYLPSQRLQFNDGLRRWTVQKVMGV